MIEQYIIDSPLGLINVEADIEIIAPQPGAQTNFLSRPEFEVLFGGAAGGGKSYMLMIDALGLQYQQHEFGQPAYLHPDYRAIIFRRETSQLAQLIDYGKAIYKPLGADFILSRKGEVGSVFDFSPVGGGKIYLAHMEHETDKDNHQGIQYQYIGFDELSHFTFTQYIYLFSRARGLVSNKAGVYLPIRIRATSNPIGEHVGWVRDRFIGTYNQQLQAGRTYYYVSDDTIRGKQVRPTDPLFKYARSRTFIPSLLKDNQILMQGDPYYALNIMQMGAKYEQALLHGDWFAFSGSFFSDFNKDLVIEPFDIPFHYPLFASIDPGYSSPCSISVATVTPKNETIILFTYYSKNKSPKEHAQEFKQRLQSFPYLNNHTKKIDMFVAGLDAFAEKERYSINNTTETFAKVFEQYGFSLLPAKTERVPGWWVLKKLMRENRLKFFNYFNQDLIQEIMEAVADDNDVEDIKGKGNDPAVSDHALDELRYLLYSIPRLSIPETVVQQFKKVRYGKRIGGLSTSEPTIMSE